ncbi:hypothetical protein KDA_51150 [Dictyobacter alpinus]|uniref:Uncharacterized protein n=1 Tax=Dictyobacter alpinus TaxID=2014873 RepID=A0A402BDW8_9CHLR|nr:hypothetical protein [Dictyobacter alpinus]GCE29631.1 hypothetical protein KDA_51150 [Dictyobacter alpinus]
MSEGRYSIRLRGHLSEEWMNWFEGLAVTNTPEGECVLRSELVDQASLHSILMKIRDLRIPLLELTRVDESHAKAQS